MERREAELVTKAVARLVAAVAEGRVSASEITGWMGPVVAVAVRDRQWSKYVVVLDLFSKGIHIVKSYDEFAKLYYCPNCDAYWAHANFIFIDEEGGAREEDWKGVECFFKEDEC